MRHGSARRERERTHTEPTDALSRADTRRGQPERRAQAEQQEAEGVPEGRRQV